ncbi:hypothetical protein EIP86_005998 [Pleurotus ostreatoroseus]|nr:hypothetical protein EIP86_005998 [Pleurotus ostreatoroseus]
MPKTHQILTAPAPGTQIRPVHQYDEEQKGKMKALSEYAHTLVLPESDSYRKWELRWLNNPDTIPRYMRAAKWDLGDAKKRIEATIHWRRDFKPDLIPPEEVRIESETGKIVINGFDKDGRPIIYMRPGLENTQQGPRQLRHLVWCLERAKDLMPPETLGRALVVNLPRILQFFYTGISPFLDPVTRDKMRFNPDLFELVPKEQLEADFGGDYEYEFEPVSYWDQIVTACGIAPDGTRVNEKEFEGISSAEPSEKIPSGIAEKQPYPIPDARNTHEFDKQPEGIPVAA